MSLDEHERDLLSFFTEGIAFIVSNNFFKGRQRLSIRAETEIYSLRGKPIMVPEGDWTE